MVSISLHVVLWLFFANTVGVYAVLLYWSPYFDRECNTTRYSQYGCTVSNAVFSWFTVWFVLIVYGLFFHLPISVGNNQFERSSWRYFISSFIALVNSVGPYFLVNYKKRNPGSLDIVITDDAAAATEDFGAFGILELTLSFGLL